MNRSFLGRVQLFDAATCFAAGLLCTAAAGPVAALTGLSEPLLRGAGVFLLLFGAVVLGSARRPSPGLVSVLMVANVGWVLASVGLLLWGGPLTALGYAAVIGQAVAVGVIAELQWTGLRRPGAPAAV